MTIKIKDLRLHYDTAVIYQDKGLLRLCYDSFRTYYLEYFTSSLDISGFAKLYGISVELADWVIGMGKELMQYRNVLK